jgi:hypothetical protein
MSARACCRHPDPPWPRLQHMSPGDREVVHGYRQDLSEAARTSPKRAQHVR